VRCTSCGDERELAEYAIEVLDDQGDDGSVGSARVEWFTEKT